MIVVDTSVVSESARPVPSVAVAEGLAAEGERPAITTVTLAEIRYGIERLPDGSRQRALGYAMDDVLSGFSATRCSRSTARPQ